MNSTKHGNVARTSTLYQQRIDRYRQQESEFEQIDLRTSRYRGIVFVAGLILLFVAWRYEASKYVLCGLLALLTAVFLVLVAIHERLQVQLREAAERRRINEDQLARGQRQWLSIPVAAVNVPEDFRAVANDLDLFGSASLFQLLCRAYTPMGIDTLRDWLLTPATPETIVDRQQAVARLAPEIELCEELSLRGRLLATSQKGPKAFLEWAEGAAWLGRRHLLKWSARMLAMSFVIVLTLLLSGLIPAAMGGLLIGIGLINVMLNVIYTADVHDIFECVSSRSNDIQHYRVLLMHLADLPDDCPPLARLKRSVGSTVHEPIRHLNSLQYIVRLANLRRSALFGILHIFLQIGVLWDFHVLDLMERWQRAHGNTVRGWFEVLARLESLVSLAVLSHDNPTWAYPEVSRDFDTIQGRSVGHPLLAEGRVRNDVQVGPPDTFLLVTGSNMSGKSTLLRSMGVNASLALAGGPVCADRFQLPPVTIQTSMRINDSLSDGISFYMAELKRLKQIVDVAQRLKPSDESRLFYLLDEILQGTNSAERQIAVARVIRHLLDNRAIGAVSTHDLMLAEMPKLADRCQAVHFRETISGEGRDQKMTFDYKMRPGVATTTNALKLLEIVGLAGNDDPDGPVAVEQAVTSKNSPAASAGNET